MVLIAVADYYFHFLVDWMNRFSFLAVPLFVLLLLPSFLLSLFFNQKISKKYRVMLDEERFQFMLASGKKKEFYDFRWREITGYHDIDFEDNHYFIFEANGKKSALIIHRKCYDFDLFLEALLKNTSTSFKKEE